MDRKNALSSKSQRILYLYQKNNGMLSATEIAKKLDLSPSHVNRLINYFKSNGFIRSSLNEAKIKATCGYNFYCIQGFVKWKHLPDIHLCKKEIIEKLKETEEIVSNIPNDNGSRYIRAEFLTREDAMNFIEYSEVSDFIDLSELEHCDPSGSYDSARNEAALLKALGGGYERARG